MDTLSAESLPWLDDARQRLCDSLRAGRLPHSLLILSPPGLGAEPLANWIAALAMCESPAARPCGGCASCSLLRSDTHPDYHVVRLTEDAKQIRVDQVRELIETLWLKSYRGGCKVAVVEGAEALNASGANAFLKTLEEPSADTVLVMIARPTHRLPATIASRCVRIALRPPSAEQGLAWLGANGGPGTRWEAALSLAGGAPLLAMELNDPGIEAMEKEMLADMAAMAAGSVDVTLVADGWVRGNLPLRLLWLENWITRRVHAASNQPLSPQSAERVRLPAALLKPKIRALFELLDAARDLRRLASTNINQQLALEALLLDGRTALAK